MEAPVNEQKLPNQRTARLFRNGRNQAIRIPVEFELAGEEVLITREEGRLVIEPKAARSKSFGELLAEFEPIPDFPDVDDRDLPPLRDIHLE